MMMKKYSIFVIILFVFNLSFVECTLFPYFESDSYVANEVFDDSVEIDLIENSVLFTPFFDSFNENELLNRYNSNNKINEIDKIQTIEREQTTKVKVTKRGFDPNIVNITAGQTVVWENEQDKLTTLVLGLREINDLKSNFLKPEEEFAYQFKEKGKYTYVDGVVIGRVGKVVVQ